MMASKATSDPTPSKGSPPAPAQGPKKSRKNPARRKAERANTATFQAPQNSPTLDRGCSTNTRPSQPVRQASAPSVIGTAMTAKTPQRNTTPVKTNVVPKPRATKAAPTNPPKSTTPQQLDSTIALPQASLPQRPKPHRSATSSNNTLSLHAPALITGGLIGCAAGAALLMAVHVWYDFAGAKAAIATARSARFCVDNLSEELIGSLHAGTYSTDEALDILHRTTLAYASTIPGGAGAVERVFREVQAVRQSRGEEIDRLLAGAYEELRAAGDKGLSAVETRDVVFAHLLRLSLLASRATQDVLTRNPRLKPYRDGAIKALKEPPKGKVPTTKVNLVVRHKQDVAA